MDHQKNCIFFKNNIDKENLILFIIIFILNYKNIYIFGFIIIIAVF